MWISRGLSTAPTYPQNLPQVYPQILPLLSTGLSTSHIRKIRYVDSIYDKMYVFIHNSGILSTIFVDKFRFPLLEKGELSTGSWGSCGQPVNNIRRVCLGDVTK